MQSYSPYFETLHDETQPVGNIGRGGHYSVLRAPVWHSENLVPFKDHARLLTFTVIWDEDHDTRVIAAAESLYLRGLLSTALFIGERKGTFTLLTPQNPGLAQIDSKWTALGRDVQTAVDKRGDEDFWPVEVAQYTGGHSILQGDVKQAAVYLENIKFLWRLGLSVPSVLMPPPPEWEIAARSQPRPATAIT